MNRQSKARVRRGRSQGVLEDTQADPRGRGEGDGTAAGGVVRVRVARVMRRHKGPRVRGQVWRRRRAAGSGCSTHSHTCGTQGPSGRCSCKPRCCGACPAGPGWLRAPAPPATRPSTCPATHPTTCLCSSACRCAAPAPAATGSAAPRSTPSPSPAPRRRTVLPARGLHASPRCSPVAHFEGVVGLRGQPRLHVVGVVEDALCGRDGVAGGDGMRA